MGPRSWLADSTLSESRAGSEQTPPSGPRLSPGKPCCEVHQRQDLPLLGRERLPFFTQAPVSQEPALCDLSLDCN